MKRVLFFFLLAISNLCLLNSCFVTRYAPVCYFAPTSVSVLGGQDISLSDGEIAIDDITFNLKMNEDNFDVVVANNSANTIKVIWDSGAYIDNYGISHHIIHTGTKIIDKEKAQLPSIIPAGASLVDITAPSDYVKTYSNYYQYSSLVDVDKHSYKTEAEAVNNVGTFNPVKLMLPIEQNGEIKEYVFTFSCNDTKIEKRKEFSIGRTVALALGAASVPYIAYLALAIIKEFY